MSVKVVRAPINGSGTFSQKNDLGLTVCYAYTNADHQLFDSALLDKHRPGVHHMAGGGRVTYTHLDESSDYTLVGDDYTTYPWDYMLIDGHPGNNIQRFVSNNGNPVTVTLNSNVGFLFLRDSNGYRFSTESYQYDTDSMWTSYGSSYTVTKSSLSRTITISKSGTKFWGFLIS